MRRRDSSGSASRNTFDRIGLGLLEPTSGRQITLGGFHWRTGAAEDYGRALATQPECQPKTTYSFGDVGPLAPRLNDLAGTDKRARRAGPSGISAASIGPGAHAGLRKRRNRRGVSRCIGSWRGGTI